MKKRILWILPIVVSVFIGILYTQVPYIYRFWFNVRHVLVYGLGAYILVFSIYLSYVFIIKKYDLKRGIRITIISVFSTVVVFGLFFMSELQVKYIELYEVPPLDSCFHYDEFGNFLFASQYPGSCPELEQVKREVIDGKEQLSFVVEEHFTGRVSETKPIENGYLVLEFDAEYSLYVEVKVTYYMKYFVEKIEISSNEIQYRSNEYGYDITNGYSYQKIVENDFGLSEITTTVSTREYDVTVDGHHIITFPQFHELEENVVKYTSIMFDKDDTTYIDISKTTYEEEVEVVDVFAKGVYRDLNNPLFMLDFYEGDRFTGNTMDAYFEYGEISIASETNYNQFYGLLPRVEYREVNFIQTPMSLAKYNDGIAGSYMLNRFNVDIDSSLSNDFDYNVDYYRVDSVSYSIDNNDISKYIKTDYGFRVEEYSTKRNSYGSYYFDLDIGMVYKNGITGVGHLTDVRKMYDYESMLYYPGILTDLHFYQHNYLLEGFFLYD